MTTTPFDLSAQSPPDWSAPWYAPWRLSAQAAWAQWRTGLPLHQALNTALTAPVMFVEAQALVAGENYERFVQQQARCPVREGWHDFFNAVVWAGFPHCKRALNQVHVAEMARLGQTPVRGAARDGATLFDESAAVLQAPLALWQSLQARDWLTLFWHKRELWQQARLTVFGHALLEQLLKPRKNLVAHVWYAGPHSQPQAQLDQSLAAQLSATNLANKPFAPLPLLGVPGWWAANQQADFYADARVFRVTR